MNKVVLDKETNKILKLVSIENIQNLAHLHDCVLSGTIQCCLIKAELVVGYLQVAVAANKAVIAEKNGTLKTKSILTETLLNLSPSHNINDALKTFGSGKNDTNCVIAIISEEGKDQEVEIEGDLTDWCSDWQDLHFTDVELVKKVYRISEEELSVSSLVDAVVSRIATKELNLLR